MRAAVCRAYGPPETITIEQFPVPALPQGHVRVAVRAAAVNFPDILIVANRYQVKVPLPFVAGSEFAGDVLEVAEGVSGLAVGDAVFGATMVGAFAEVVDVPATSLTPIPSGVKFREAAAFGVAHRTAYHVLRSVARLKALEQLVVLGAGGGVGLAAVQLGAALGATVTAVASSAQKLEVAQHLGATHLVNYRSKELRSALQTAVPDGVDVVIDPVGGDLAEPALRSMKSGGRFVTVGYASGEIPRIPLNLVLLKGVQVVGFQFKDFAAHAPEDLHRNEAELLDLLGAGRALPHIGASFPLHKTGAALRHVADGKAIGKVVLDIASSTG